MLAARWEFTASGPSPWVALILVVVGALELVVLGRRPRTEAARRFGRLFGVVMLAGPSRGTP